MHCGVVFVWRVTDAAVPPTAVRPGQFAEPSGVWWYRIKYIKFYANSIVL
jgi:hypothetical protein